MNQNQIPVNEIFLALNERAYVLEGVHGVFSYECHYHKRSRTWSEHLYHCPSDEGRRSKEYQTRASDYGDDWVSELTDSPSLYLAAADELGILRDTYWEELTPRLLVRRGIFVLVRYGATEFTVYRSPYPDFEEFGQGDYGESFEAIGHAIANLVLRHRADLYQKEELAKAMQN